MTVDFGFGLITCQRYPGDPRSDTELYRQALALAEDADAFGLESVWVSEHHFVNDAYLPSLLPLCAAIATRTRRVRVGTALLLAPLHDPVRIAGGDLHYIARLYFPGLPWEVQQRTLRLFAEQVIPRARALAARGAA